jgi:hypothetical protein
LSSITLPNSLTSIEGWAFSECISLTSFTFPNSLTSIGEVAFGGCSSLTSIALPNSLTSIDYSTFICCSGLISITFPNSLESIAIQAFSMCSSLTSITIPKSVTKIGWSAFYGCASLTSITNLNPVPIALDPYYDVVFEGVNQAACTLNVPMTSVSAYQNAYVWKEFNIVGINVGIETIEATIVNIYPNPTAGKLRIESGELRIENVVIYDVFGKIQKIENWGVESAIDISHLPTGIYFVKINTEAGEVVRKVVKE